MLDLAPVKPLWTPSRSFMEQSNLKKFQNWLFVKKGLYFKNYHDLWDWSVTDLDDFWESVWQFCEVKSHSLYFEVLIRQNRDFIGTKWFRGATVNYAEHIFRHKNPARPAIMFQSEQEPLRELSWRELEKQVGAVAVYLRQSGVVAGDRVVAVLPNGPQAVVAFLATNSLGAVWSSCSPDFGTTGILDRFQQIEPKVLIVADGYTYNGKGFDKLPAMRQLISQLPTLKRTVLVPYLNSEAQLPKTDSWKDVLKTSFSTLEFTPVPFDHPLWVVYSSGTTGKPKAITHSVGGCLLEHLKALTIHQNVKPGDRYFWYSTTGWMMWNFSVASMLAGATLVLYEGAVQYPTMNVLWDLAEKAKINHFGGGAAFYLACMKAGVSLQGYKFNQLQSIGSTGSPLPPEAFEWIYQHVKKDVWLISLSGGTDICSAFVGGCPTLPVYSGEIQCRLLGCKLEAYDEAGNPVQNELGEMVITQPMPSMPIYFWNDKDNQRYRASYFENYPNIWRHGDWIKINDRGGIIIYGRSDATLNRDGVRIGTGEIYSAVESVPEVTDSLVVCLEQTGGKYFMPLFVVLAKGQELTDDLKKKINLQLRSQFSPRHVPDAIYELSEVPYTISGKKMEAPVKKILMGTDPAKAASRDTMRNPQALDFFAQFNRAQV
ncbi:acetoacetate--CoA ligase [Runella salmonicolor]|uniref:Acetoacetate--CoA ligase n=1 Tax=Runella salmonicolor TaxID=2950278 RepID=A0ABT1FV24_9BACT|nr:acetoacetate--CoA ligase [Runella salmonicolor]MCP1384513.1 acetoacetate--CoA ligase [Runella salmonicolor]